MVLKELCELRGVSGDEYAVRDYILEKARAAADSVEVDRMGNVIAFKKGTAPKGKHVMLAAHMDEVGFIVKGIKDNGMLAYMTVGGIDPRVVISKPVCVGKKAVPGVIGAKAIHLQSADEYHSVMGHDKLCIDIGAQSKEEAAALVQPGDYVTFDSEWVEFGDGFVKARALDDRIGCMVMLSLLEGEYPCDLTCAFTVQEEVGMRGAHCAADHVHPDCAVILEGTTANDLGDIPPHLRVCAPGKGVAVSFMDRTSIGHKDMGRAIRDLADAQGIAWQYKSYVSGGNDAGAVQRETMAVPVCALSIPCRNIHSPSSVCALRDIEAMYMLAEAFLLNGGAY